MKETNIIKLRNKLNLTQKEFAKKIGRSQAWVSGCESRSLIPSKKMSLKLIDIAAKIGMILKYESLRSK